MKVTGSVAVVTGGGSGIGAAMCRRFRRERPEAIVVVDRDLDAARRSASDCDGWALECDVSVESDVLSMVGEVVERYARVDLFCANAGVTGDGDLEAEDARWLRCWQTNVMGLLYSARAVFPTMSKQQRGYFLATISAAGMLTAPHAMPYGASKHAALALTEALAIEYGDRGILVSALCPGAVDTPLLMEVLEEPTRLATLAVSAPISSDEAAERVVEGIAAERFLILTHPETAGQYRRRAAEPDRWIRDVRARIHQEGKSEVVLRP